MPDCHFYSPPTKDGPDIFQVRLSSIREHLSSGMSICIIFSINESE
ncbi:hypothetical protein CEV32_3466 [Brucella rhizosphaerae]|uniref:Uncharacterized protein n=1 Tax=Brucella rhizosphaerae TaxID=571254 RepID=A0A256FT84_9HYPH|nr:hypothetical protein CEV32_3466 [Brucella rhizosphaerae]